MSMICFQRGSMGDWNLLIDPLICNWNWPLIITVHFKSFVPYKVSFIWKCIFAFRNKKQIGFAVKVVLFCFQLKLFVLYLEIGQSFFLLKHKEELPLFSELAEMKWLVENPLDSHKDRFNLNLSLNVFIYHQITNNDFFQTVFFSFH